MDGTAVGTCLAQVYLLLSTATIFFFLILEDIYCCKGEPGLKKSKWMMQDCLLKQRVLFLCQTMNHEPITCCMWVLLS